MEFNIHLNDDKTGYFLDSLVSHKSLKLADDTSNQFNHQYIIKLAYWNYLNMIIHDVCKWL